MFSPGQQIGSYILVNRLGRGGFGEVWLAERRMKFVTTKVALKLPLDSEIDYEAIKREALIWERASGHPNVVPIIEADEYDGQAIVVSEYIDGGPLNHVLEKRDGSFSADEAVRLTMGILAGLEYLHSRGIIHRDVKPANILLQGETPRLIDFGVSRIVKATVSLSSAGTPHYMAPEAFDGVRSAQTDIWSVGILLYEMLTGGYPFRGDGVMEIMGAILNREPAPLPSHIDPSIRDVIARALQKRPLERYRRAEDMRRELQGLIFKTRPDLDISLHETVADEPSTPATLGFSDDRKRSIAILPFRNLSGDAAVQFYEFSLADAVTTELARLRSITVRPSSMIARYQEQGIDPCDAGREMMADAVLAGAFMASGKRIRVTAQLLNVASREIVWSDRIDADTDDIFALQDLITQHIISGLNLTITTSEQERLDRPPTAVNEAYEAYLRGRHYWGRYIFQTISPVDCDAAIESFALATQLDPGFALAWSALGSCYVNKVWKAMGHESDLENAGIAFRRALGIDPGLAESRVMMVWVYLAKGEKAKANIELASVMTQCPNDPAVIFCSATMHRIKGRYGEALAALARLEKMDPASMVAVKWSRGRIHSLMGDHELGLREIDEGLALEPSHAVLKIFRAQVLFSMGDAESALAAARDTLNANPHLEGLRPFLAMLLAWQNEPDEARQQLTPDVLRRSQADYDIAYWTAATYALLGDVDAALHWLERSIQLGLENRRLFESDRTIVNLHNDARFKMLMDGIG